MPNVPLIYFDHAATSLPKPDVVIEAVATALRDLGSASRGAHEPALLALRNQMKVRLALAAMFGVSDPLRIVLTSGATASLNQAIAGLKGHVLTTAASHNSVLRPLYRHGNVDIVSLNADGTLDLDRLENRIRPETTAIVIGHASNVTGNVIDAAAVGEICARHRLLYVLDAAQTAGLLPIELEKWHVTALAASGHKSLYGPQGTGVLALANGFLPPALIVGGSGTASFAKEQPDTLPDALEAGTQNAHGMAGLLAGIHYVQALGDKALARPTQLAASLIAGLQAMDDVLLYGDLNAAMRLPVVAFNLRGRASSEVAERLFSDFRICVRAGAHCAPLMHETLGTVETGIVRVSLAHTNSAQEVEVLLDALRCIQKKNEG